MTCTISFVALNDDLNAILRIVHKETYQEGPHGWCMPIPQPSIIPAKDLIQQKECPRPDLSIIGLPTGKPGALINHEIFPFELESICIRDEPHQITVVWKCSYELGQHHHQRPHITFVPDITG